MALYWKDVNGRNWPVCSCLKAWLTAYQNELLRVGEIKHGLDLYQTIGGAVDSAGYHLYGGNVDTEQTSKRAITIARNMGGAAFGRGPADGMTPHCHIALKGCPHMRGGPRWQVTELEAGRDGLMGRDRDRGPRTGVKWPLRTYTQGIVWARALKALSSSVAYPGTVKKVAKYRVTSTSLYGYSALTSNPKPIVTTLVKGDVFMSQAYLVVKGNLWVQHANGNWFDGKHLDLVVAAPPKPAPVPKPVPVAVKTNLRPMTYNLPDESKLPNAKARVPAAVALIKTGKPTFVMMQECVGIDKDGHASVHSLAIDKAFGANWGAVIPTLPLNENYIWYDSLLLELVKRYPDTILTSPGGGRHITRAVFRHKQTGLIFAVGDTHLVNDHDGVQYEESRQSQGVQGMAAMTAVSVLHGNCPIIIGGDLNTPNLIQAFLDGGLQSVAVGAAETANLKYQSYANISDDTPNLGKQIDQLYASKAFTMGGLSVLLGLDATGTWPALRPSDHVPVLGSITI